MLLDDGRDQCRARHAGDQGERQRQLREHHREPEIAAEHEEFGDRQVEDAEDSHHQRVGQGDQGVDRPKCQAVHELLDQHLSVPVEVRIVSFVFAVIARLDRAIQ